jgi:anti-sigma B factor antagonist
VFSHGTVTSADGLDITVDHGDAGTVVRLRGQLSIESSPGLRDHLLAMLREQSPKTVIVDLAGVSYIDVSGIATLIEALKVQRNRQGTLCLKGLEDRLVRLFEVTGLLALFEASGCKSASTVEVS